jgi:outer membrane protein OmpA-like peptidoglycan-associated protein
MDKLHNERTPEGPFRWFGGLLALHLTLCFLLLQPAPALSQPRDTIRVLFPLDRHYLTDKATKQIDSLIAAKVLERNKKMIVLGFGDYLGTSEYNDNLSYFRAKNVEEYLLMANFRKENITLLVGKGKIVRPANGSGYPNDRKVEIIFDKKLDTPAKEKFFHYLYRMEVNETIALRNIHFYRGSIRIIPESLTELQYLVQFLAEHPTWRIQLEGHICCLGPLPGKDEPYDESTLSQKRAEVIRDSLVARGIDRSRLQCVGLGNNFMLNDEETGEEQALNRRVEVRVLSK